MLTVFDDMIENTESNKKVSPIITEFLRRGRKFSFSCFCATILFVSGHRSKIKRETFYHENI